jgi:hypothetical protein
MAPDLEDANLFDTNLRGANLSEAKLPGAFLIWTDLCDTDLARADLSGEDLTMADLWSANLQGTHLKGSNLSGARMGFTIFAENDLSTVKGLETVWHSAPSTVGIDTIYKSKGKIPEAFLRGGAWPRRQLGKRCR